MPPSVFISYSHKDRVWKDRLLTHLKVAEKGGLLDLWDDRRIAAGAGWRSEIEKAIGAAEIGILLISADFLASDFICGEEIPRMLERRTRNGMHLFPVLLRSCDWQIVKWLEPIQIRPTGARPLADFRGDSRDAQMAAIAREVRSFLTSPPGHRDPAGAVAEAEAIVQAVMSAGFGSQPRDDAPTGIPVLDVPAGHAIRDRLLELQTSIPDALGPVARYLLGLDDEELLRLLSGALATARSKSGNAPGPADPYGIPAAEVRVWMLSLAGDSHLLRTAIEQISAESLKYGWLRALELRRGWAVRS